MPALIRVLNSYSPPFLYVNDGVSSAITNTTTETAFSQFLTFPNAAQRYIQPITMCRIKATGIMSTGLLNLGLTLRLRWGGISGSIICTTGSFNLAASLSDAGWAAESIFLITAVGTTGAMEVQGNGSFSSGLISASLSHMSNNASFTIDTTITNDVVLTAQWGTATANNSIQIRTLTSQIDGV